MSLIDIERMHSGPDYACLPNTARNAAEQTRYTQCCATLREIPFHYAFAFLCSVTYYGYAIQALSYSQYTDEEHQCVYSGMWIYLLLSLISNISLIYIRQLVSSSHDEKYIQNLICGNAVMTFYRVGFFAWGTSVMFSSGCKKIMHGTLMYNMCGVQYVVDMAMLGGLFFHSGYIIPLLMDNSRDHREAVKDLQEMDVLGSAANDAQFTRSIDV